MPEKRDRDETVSLAPLSPEEALRGLLRVDSNKDPTEDETEREED